MACIAVRMDTAIFTDAMGCFFMALTSSRMSFALPTASACPVGKLVTKSSSTFS